MKQTDSVAVLSGVGKAREASLNKMGIFTVGDLLSYWPRAYQNRGNISTVAKATLDAGMTNTPAPASVLVTIGTEPTIATLKGRLKMVKFRAFDSTGNMSVTFFNMPYVKNVFHVGEEYRLYGRPHLIHGRLEMTNPLYENAAKPEELLPIVPIYRVKSGISQKYMQGLVREAITSCEIEDFLPLDTLREYSLSSMGSAIRSVHFPNETEDISKSVRRLAFNEVFLTSCALAGAKTVKSGRADKLENQNVTPLLEALPYELTGAQKKAVSEIAADLKKETPMRRILCGDVGSGKTVVAEIASYIAIRSKKSAALMAPTEILAKQHFADFKALFEPLGVPVYLLCGSMTAKEKNAVKAELETDTPKIVVGTHALLSGGVELSKFGLVITDEQHRFGVSQRATILEKTKNAHSLVMSATPIPRTLSLVIYGELDISRLDEMPPGRQVVSTFAVDESYRDRLWGFIEKQKDEGHGVYVVCPAIEEPIKENENSEELYNLALPGEDTEEEVPMKAATKYAEDLSKACPNLRVGIIHGKLKTAEKDAVMEAFAAGELDVLVSTTVIEVGVNVPSATLMVVENAERFGLSQLHQLRGRVGRGSAKSYCILVSESKEGPAKERLDTMCSSHDGYAIAEADLKQRGPGDFLRSGGDIRQHGQTQMNFASQLADTDLIVGAAEAARELIASDPLLSDHPEIRDITARMRDSADNTIN